jgi:hypothetical protein
MRRATQDFLGLVRDAENPTPEDDARVRQALRAAIARGAAASIDPHAPGYPRSTTQLPTALAGWGSKLSLIAVCAATALSTGDRPRSTMASTPAALTSLEEGAAVATPTASEATPAAQLGTQQMEPVVAPASAPAAPAAKHSREPARRVRAPLRAVPSLGAELELLRRVQAALQQGDGETALRELDAHVTTDRTLLPERRAARILALCRVGRVDAVRLARAEFVRDYPDSVQREAVERACANR